MPKTLIVLLAFLVMPGPLAIDTYLPSIPAIAASFGVGPLLVQQTLSIYLAGFALMTLFYGTLSDSFGRRPVILASLALYAVASLGAALAQDFATLLAWRLVQGLAAGGGWVVGQAVVRDVVAGAAAQRALATIMMVFGLAPAVAPIIGGWLQVLAGWRSIFVFLAGCGALMLAASWRLLPETLPPTKRQRLDLPQICANYGRALARPRFTCLILAIGLAFSGFGLYIGSAPYFVMTILQLPETAFAWLFVPLIGGMVVGSALAARWSGRFAAGTLIRIGYGAMSLAALGNVAYNLAFTAAVPLAVVPIMIYAFGFSLAAPALMVAALDELPQHHGLASSLQSFVQLLAFSLVSGLVAPLLFESALKLSLGVCTGLALSLLLLLGLRRRGRAVAAAT